VPRLRKPRALRPGATLGVAAPGGVVKPERLEAGLRLLRAAGFETRFRDDLLARDAYLAGDDARRARELMELVEDPGVDGIVCARGGYGCDRILDRLDAARVRAAAKPLVGYSDITVLLLWQLRRAGLTGFHGPMLDRGEDVDPACVASLRDQLTGKAKVPLVLAGRGARGGRAEGRLLGGSLSMLAAGCGTPWALDARGAILLLEDTNELTYRVDRLLQQLRAAGCLRGLRGLGIGDFSTCGDRRYPERSPRDLFLELAERTGVPLVTDLPFGHVAHNAPWPFGVRATLDGDSGELHILERGVSRG